MTAGARFLRIGLGVLLTAACGSAGGQIASKVGSAVADAAGRGGGLPERQPWNSDSGRCGVFGDYQMACPVLPDCQGMERFQAPAVNACYSNAGLLKPVRVCTDWHQNPYWCASGEFPRCRRLLGAPCGDFEVVVCDDEPGRRVLGCCAASGVEPECRAGTYTELRRRAPEALQGSDAGVSEAASDSGPAPAEDAASE